MFPPLEMRASKWLLPGLTLIAVLIFWELAIRIGGSPNSPPAPSTLLMVLARDAGFFASNAGFTLLEATAGFGLALVAAFIASSAFALSPLAHASLMPLVLAAQTVPMLAIAPLLAREIGDGMFANIVVAAYLCWFPPVIAFTHGFLNVAPERLALFEVHRATPWKTWRRLRLPGAAPALVAGARASAGLALISAIVAEYGTITGGLGAVIVRHVRQMEVLLPDRLFALIVVASLCGIAFTETAHWLSKYVLREWLPEE